LDFALIIHEAKHGLKKKLTYGCKRKKEERGKKQDEVKHINKFREQTRKPNTTPTPSLRKV